MGQNTIVNNLPSEMVPSAQKNEQWRKQHLDWATGKSFFNYSLVFGKFDFPKLGISGIGWGTAITFWITAFGFSLYFYLNKNYHIYFKLSCWKKIISHLYQIFLILIHMFLIEALINLICHSQAKSIYPFLL